MQSSSYLAEVSHGMAPLRVVERHDVEKKGLHVVVQRFVVQEELGE